MKGSGAELYVVPGNEDDPEILKEYFEDSVVEPGTVVEIGGVKFALGHKPEEVARLNADFKLYGHNFKVMPRGLNGLRSINIVFLPSKRVVKISYPPPAPTLTGVTSSGGDCDEVYAVRPFNPVFTDPPHPEAVSEGITKIFGVEPIPTDQAIKDSSEFETLLFVTAEWQKETIPPEVGFLIRDSARSVLAAIINNDLPIEKVHVRVR